MTFLVYVVTSLVALAATWPASGAARALARASEPGGALLLEHLQQARSGWSASLTAVLSAMMVSLLLWPLVQMAWLSSLWQPMPVAEALRRAATRYLPTLLVSGLLLLPLLLASAVLVGVPVLAHLWLDGTDARLHDLTLLVLTIPGLLLLGAWSVWHDLSRASLAQSTAGAVRATQRALSAMTLHGLATYVAWMLAGAALSLSGHLLGGWLDGPGPWRAILVMAALQPIALLAVAARGAWLASALGLLEDRQRPRTQEPLASLRHEPLHQQESSPPGNTPTASD